MGRKTAGYFIQKSLNILNRNQTDWLDIDVDGIIGSITLYTLNYVPRNRLLNLYKTLNIYQGARYIKIVEKEPLMEFFFNGWLERVWEN